MNTTNSILATITVIVLLSACGESSNGNGDNDSTQTRERRRIINVCIADDDSSDLGMTLIVREQTMWCWAACGEMTMEFVDTTIDMRQCDQANHFFGIENCCESDLDPNCNGGGIPEFEYYGFEVDSIDRALTLDEIKEQIGCKKSPICAIWRWNFGGEHMVVASGYKKIDGIDYIVIKDPRNSEESEFDNDISILNLKTYEEYNGGSPYWYTHGKDYYNLKKIQ